jgi:hypothetical protein
MGFGFRGEGRRLLTKGEVGLGGPAVHGIPGQFALPRAQ